MEPKEEQKIITYLVYDKKTGRIIHTHREFNLEKGEYCECDFKEVLSLIEDDHFAMSKVTDKDPAYLEIIVTSDLPRSYSPGKSAFYLDLKTRKVVEKPKVILITEKNKLVGDGKDQTVIKIQVVDSKGDIDATYSGQIKVTTSRGKLSATGGVVKMERGIGTVTLTAVNETVDRVKLTATCLKGQCFKGNLELEFI